MALTGLNEYLHKNYDLSIFDTAFQSQAVYTFHLHQHRVISARVKDIQKYDVVLDVENQVPETMPKLHIKYLFEKEITEAVGRMISVDADIRKKALETIRPPAQRHHIKNKTLYPLMKERTVLFFTLLEGELIRGIVAGFSKYELMVHLKGGKPVTILRHAVYDVRDKKGRSYLKQIQQKARDWKKSTYYVNH